MVRWMGLVSAFMTLSISPAAGEMLAAIPQGPGGSGYPIIEIWKSERRMQYRYGDSVLREFRVSLGRQPREGKQVQGDQRTPVGRYFISEKKPGSQFHRFLGISYPNGDDAERGYRNGLIDAAQWADIYLASLRQDPPPQGTRLGGRVGIHGFGGRPYLPVDWTEGCVAISDQEIEYLFENVPVGTPVIIHE